MIYKEWLGSKLCHFLSQEVLAEDGEEVHQATPISKASKNLACFKDLGMPENGSLLISI